MKEPPVVEGDRVLVEVHMVGVVRKVRATEFGMEDPDNAKLLRWYRFNDVGLTKLGPPPPLWRDGHGVLRTDGGDFKSRWMRGSDKWHRVGGSTVATDTQMDEWWQYGQIELISIPSGEPGE